MAFYVPGSTFGLLELRLYFWDFLSTGLIWHIFIFQALCRIRFFSLGSRIKLFYYRLYTWDLFSFGFFVGRVDWSLAVKWGLPGSRKRLLKHWLSCWVFLSPGFILRLLIFPAPYLGLVVPRPACWACLCPSPIFGLSWVQAQVE